MLYPGQHGSRLPLYIFIVATFLNLPTWTPGLRADVPWCPLLPLLMDSRHIVYTCSMWCISTRKNHTRMPTRPSLAESETSHVTCSGPPFQPGAWFARETNSRLASHQSLEVFATDAMHGQEYTDPLINPSPRVRPPALVSCIRAGNHVVSPRNYHVAHELEW